MSVIKYEVHVYSNGSKYWYLNGNLHREDGPAIEKANGSKVWYLNGKYHRVDGPAYEYSNGYKSWWINGKLHREDGPAVEYVNGTTEYWINGEQLTESEFNNRTKIKELTVAEIQSLLGYKIKVIE